MEQSQSATLPPAAGVVCEFNPFHNGHVRLLAAMRAAVGEDGCVVCVMSGRFVQRGTSAVADPYLRAAAALCGGADLVVELPFPWSAGSAADFAAAGVDILDRMGVGTLAFGSECADASLLSDAARIAAEPDFTGDVASRAAAGAGAAAAWADALRARLDREYGDSLIRSRTRWAVALRAQLGRPMPDGFPGPNDRLAVNYLASLRASGSPMRTLIVPRTGQEYRDDVLTDASAPSATALRVLLAEAADDPDTLREMLDGTMPDGSLDVLMDAVGRGDAPCREDALLPYLHGLFRLGSADALSHIAGLSGGLAHRMVKAAQEAGTPGAFMQSLHSRLYTDARLRRGMLYAACGVLPEDLRARPAYTTLLGATSRGCAYLKALGKAGAGSIPVVTKPADAPACRQTDLLRLSDALFSLCLPVPRGAGALMKRSPVIRTDTGNG